MIQGKKFISNEKGQLGKHLWESYTSIDWYSTRIILQLQQHILEEQLAYDIMIRIDDIGFDLKRAISLSGPPIPHPTSNT